MMADDQTMMTVGELMAKCLQAEGVKFMCGIVDGAHIPLVSHLGDYGIEYLNTHHEEAATHIAEAHARISHRPTVVIGNPGPGGANMLAGLSPNGPAPGRRPTWWTWPSRSPSTRR